MYLCEAGFWFVLLASPILGVFMLHIYSTQVLRFKTREQKIYMFFFFLLSHWVFLYIGETLCYSIWMTVMCVLAMSVASGKEIPTRQFSCCLCMLLLFILVLVFWWDIYFWSDDISPLIFVAWCACKLSAMEELYVLKGAMSLRAFGCKVTLLLWFTRII